MRQIFHLGNCDTCQKIIKSWQPSDEIILQNIKTDPITAAQIDEMQRLAGSYEALFSRVAMKYKSMDLKAQNLQEPDYRRLILAEYTFLKRPVLVLEEQIFIGNSPKNVAAALAALSVANLSIADTE